MFKLAQITNDYREAGAFCAQVNLFGFVDEEIFLTKSGDLGIILGVEGVDYECLGPNTIENLTRRLTAAFRIFDEKCRVYQYLFKRNREKIPYKTYQNPIVNAATESRIAYLASKAESLYSFEIYYVVLYEGFRYRTSLLATLAKLGSLPREALRELRAFLSVRNQTVLIDGAIEQSAVLLRAKARSFLTQVGDFVSARLLHKQESFRVLKKILNFSPSKIENVRLKHDTFLDYYLCESHLECHRGFLRVDDYFVKVLTLKEPSAESFPLIFKRLLEVEANYFICSEWKKQDPASSRSFIHSRRRHFHNTKRSLSSYLTASDQPQRGDDILIDESKEAQIRDLGEALKELEINGNYFGGYSLTIVVYDQDFSEVERACADFYKAFSIHDAQLYQENYNLFNAYLATVPGNRAFNLRSMFILNTNHADYSFLFTLHAGHKINAHLNQEYLAVLETNHRTPYYFNLHCKDTAHSVILGRTGAGESESFTRPCEIHRFSIRSRERELWARQSIPFKSEDYAHTQVWFKAKDGTLIPMVLVSARNADQSQPRPAIMTAYGGYGVSMTPQFSVLVAFLLERGCLFALPNIRGGSEFGATWHQAAKRRNRQVAIDDFLGAAEWLIETRKTAPERVAIFGGSNSGLLVGAALTQRPDLFRAVLCMVPMLDMLRYHLFDNAAVWKGEFGTSDDPEDFAALLRYSPYHAVRDGVDYPATMIVSGDLDKNCNPLHARKMTARLQAASASRHPIILDYNEFRGHSPVLPLSTRTSALADRLAFLCKELGVPF